MARFTTRVELHEVSSNQKPDYEKLHEEMAKQKFTRTITTDKNTKVQMPEAEYNKEGSYTLEQVLASAKVAAANVTKDFSILVTESNGRTWHNLKEVKQ